MSDDLVKRSIKTLDEAADRIEQLDRERIDLMTALDKTMSVLDTQTQFLFQARTNLESVQAKLAKALDLAVYAVNALDEIQTYEQPDDPWTENALTMGELDAFDFNVEIARATLKDLGVDMV
jgi:ABC-type transporter Mla subunit MlaD